MFFDWPEIIRSLFSEQVAFTVAMAVLLIGVVSAYVAWRMTRRLLKDYGVNEAVDNTTFERTVRSVGTSTVGILAFLAAAFVYISSVVLALNVAQLVDTQLFWSRLTAYLPRLFVAALAVIAGLVIGDKAKLTVSERLKSVKLPEVGVIPELVKYSIYYIFGLIALGQIGVATGALLILLLVYVVAVVLLFAVAFWDLLRAGAAGIYILLSQPYSIGDEIRIGEYEGIVQEVDMFTTHVESDGEEYIIPNQQVFSSTIVRIRG